MLLSQIIISFVYWVVLQVKMNHTKIINTILAIVMISCTPMLMANSGEKLYQKCITCHGAYAEKRALGKSKVIQKMDVNQINEALLGYQTDTYGGPMKTLMQEQVKNFSENDIRVISEYIILFKSFTK